jgi:hypothetical protein
MRRGSGRLAKISVSPQGSSNDAIRLAVFVSPCADDPFWNRFGRACLCLHRLSRWRSIAQLVNAQCPRSIRAFADPYPESVNPCGISFLDRVRIHANTPRFEFIRVTDTPKLKRDHANINCGLEALDDRSSAGDIQSGRVGSRKSSAYDARGLWAGPDGG